MEGKFPGQRLIERLETRARRRPRVGLSPAFYLRLGLPDPWLDIPVDAEPGRHAGEFTLVSAGAYSRMMQRLALSRIWRERRYSQAFGRWAGVRTAERRRFPGELSAPKSVFAAGASVSSPLDFVMPRPWAAEPAAEEVAAAQPSRRSSSSGAAPRRAKRGAWYRRPVPEALAAPAPRVREVLRAEPPRARPAPAPEVRVVERVGEARGSGPTPQRPRATTLARDAARPTPLVGAQERLAEERLAEPAPPPRLRPAQRVGVRAQENSVESAPLFEVLERAGVSSARARRIVVEVEARGGVERVIEVRRVLRRALRQREVESIAESLPDAVSEPLRVAAGRGPAPGQRARGLRPALASSPTFALVAPEETAVGPEASAPRSARAAPAAWASARSELPRAESLSASPVKSPAARASRALAQARLSASPVGQPALPGPASASPFTASPFTASPFTASLGLAGAGGALPAEEAPAGSVLAVGRLERASTPRQAWRVGAAPALDMATVRPAEGGSEASKAPTQRGWARPPAASGAERSARAAARSTPVSSAPPVVPSAALGAAGSPDRSAPGLVRPDGVTAGPAAVRPALARPDLARQATAGAVSRLMDAELRAPAGSTPAAGDRAASARVAALGASLGRHELEELLAQPERVRSLLARAESPVAAGAVPERGAAGLSAGRAGAGVRPARAVDLPGEAAGATPRVTRPATPLAASELEVLRPSAPATVDSAGARTPTRRALPRGLASAAVREPGGRFVSAREALLRAARPGRRAPVVSVEESPLALSSARPAGSTWAAERLDVAQAQTQGAGPPSEAWAGLSEGLAPRLRSLLPRLARVSPASPVLLTAQSVEEAEELATALRRVLPKASVTVSRVSARGEPTAAGPREGIEGQSNVAAGRAERLPLTGYTAARAASGAPAAPARSTGPMGWAHAPLLSLLMPAEAAQAQQALPAWSSARRLPEARAARVVSRGQPSYTPVAFGPAERTHTPTGQPQRARQVRLPQGQVARVAAPRPLDWVEQRTGVAQATAYRGAFGASGAGVGSAGLTMSGVGVPLSLPGGAEPTFAPAQRAERMLGGGGAGTHRAGLPDMQLPPSFTRLEPSAGSGADPGVAPAARSGWSRPSVYSTLGQVSGGELPVGAPSWADRSVRATRIHTVGELVDSLARATDPGQVIRIIAQDGAKVRASSGLPSPVIELMHQIGSESEAVESRVAEAHRAARRPAPESEVLARTGRSGTSRPSNQVLRGFTGLRTHASARTAAGVGEDRIMGLVRKLQGLIHLAENQNRLSDAQRQVRLAAADGPSSRVGQGDSGHAEASEKANVDIEALAREVMESVNRELELRRERRPEDTDVNGWW